MVQLTLNIAIIISQSHVLPSSFDSTFESRSKSLCFKFSKNFRIEFGLILDRVNPLRGIRSSPLVLVDEPTES